MVTMPPETPVTTPLPLPTVAIPVLLLLQVPPETASLSVEVAGIIRLIVPVIVAGRLTVTVARATVGQPVE
jgi:hypothetical protein